MPGSGASVVVAYARWVSSTSPDHSAVGDAAAAGAAEEHVLVDPTRVRRAPRYATFLWLGGVVGVVLGILLGMSMLDDDDPLAAPVLKPGVFVSVIVLATTTAAVLLAGLVAVLLDRRSLRRFRDR
jgi:hypothetical protein